MFPTAPKESNNVLCHPYFLSLSLIDWQFLSAEYKRETDRGMHIIYTVRFCPPDIDEPEADYGDEEIETIHGAQGRGLWDRVETRLSKVKVRMMMMMVNDDLLHTLSSY